jgi:hypothetical protein
MRETTFDQLVRTVHRPGVSRRGALRRIAGASMAAAVAGMSHAERSTVAQEEERNVCCIYWEWVSFDVAGGERNHAEVITRLCTASSECRDDSSTPGYVTAMWVDDCDACPAYP